MFGAWRRGSASALGAESRWFKSSRPDHFGVVTVCRDSFFLFVVRRRSRRSAALKPRKGSDCAKLCAFWSEGAGGRSSSRRGVSRLARSERASLRHSSPKDAEHVSAAEPSTVFLQGIFGVARKRPERTFLKIGVRSAMFFRKSVRIAAEACGDGAGKEWLCRSLPARKEKIFFRLVLPRRELRQNDGRKMKTCCPGMFFFTSA